MNTLLFGDAAILETLGYAAICRHLYRHRYSEALDIIIRYEDNGLVHYDGKDYVESLARVQREKSVTGALQIGENVTVKTKSHAWKTRSKVA